MANSDAPAKGLLATSIGVGLATGFYGISFGALSSAAGLDLWQTMVLSLAMFSGGSQFAFVAVAAGGSGAVAAAITSAWLLGIRNGFYAVRLAPVLKLVGLKRWIGAMVTIDESLAVAIAQEKTADQRRGFWWTGAAVYLFWNSATFLGALIGDAVGKPENWGLDAAAAAAFVGLVWPRLKERQALIVAIAAVIVATAVSPFVPAGIPVLIAGSVALIVGFTNWFASSSREVQA
ncbi:MAG: AzlC family ABC transporter permease [Actinomycetales bacterium]|nr:AzlC family ABC transporter permease [Actinomycetales bacterium]